ncbi:S-adenosyl-L-methionine-dependent methyltransferase [Metschnikowia bicuspidata var. bicuspidata NRRL YB-4993]|uniref:S-adenosyl-L-methionine-dependent methyltransferase n=1 Tax=Metschnikowia bicuspidata var. bicuspidata NRRL YB-4993 TaxID=869754 RepID=A0A1A0H759_9ASCO|nr:S-adenosyl-L-methionine-dependent methyltransferase [Metschnikowia bicuspidata var. bicuspidata NRRL YB-4993]OBA19861.1 S-adenosyl-L-methionine-dependent methyltransferase [Metschnikowia bicuspidata var. bicuspidata NRRL YB-4993]
MLPTPYVRNLDERVYDPAEDSFLLLDALEECLPQLRLRQFPVVCEIGAGSGIVSAFLKMHVFPHGLFFATDVNPAACDTIVATVRENDTASRFATLDVFQMSLALALRSNHIDVLVFNPPYVPAEAVPERPAAAADPAWLDLALLGGSDGMVVTWQVLDGLHRLLAADGVAYILFCARNKPDSVARVMEDRGWAVRTVLHRKAGWEVLSVLEFRRA